MNKSKIFRHDINALRAISVLLVLFFHCEFEWAMGGYVGVDFLDISTFYCSDQRCRVFDEKLNSLLWDRMHLTPVGVEKLSTFLIERIEVKRI